LASGLGGYGDCCFVQLDYWATAALKHLSTVRVSGLRAEIIWPRERNKLRERDEIGLVPTVFISKGHPGVMERLDGQWSGAS